MFNWKVAWMALASLTVGGSCAISGAPTIITIASVIGISYVCLVAYGRTEANLFGAILASLFGYVSYQNGFFGNATVNLLFCVPASLWGWWYWNKNKNSPPRKMKWQTLWTTIIVTLGGCAIGMAATLNSGSSQPILDGITAFLPIAGTILLVTRFREQWLVWIPYNLLEVVMWFGAMSIAPEVLSIFVMRVVFLLNSILGAYLWYKE